MLSQHVGAVALGTVSVGMLLPIINGYSLIQIGIIAFAGMDFKSADLVWCLVLDYIHNSGSVVQISPSDSEALLLALYKFNLCMLRLNSLRSGASVPRGLAESCREREHYCLRYGWLSWQQNYISVPRYANLRTHVQDSV